MRDMVGAFLVWLFGGFSCIEEREDGPRLTSAADLA